MSESARGARLLPSVAISLATVLLHACGDDPTAPPGPDEVPAIISPAAQWSGGTVTLEWPWLEGREVLPEFRSGDSVLTAERLDDSTVTLILPYLTTGPAAISAVVEEESFPLGSVSLYGYTSSDPFPWLGALRPWPSPLRAEVIGVDLDDGSLDVVDLATGASRGTGPLPIMGWRIDEVGLSYRAGVALAFDNDFTNNEEYPWIDFWRIDPAPVKVDSLFTGTADRTQVYELGPGRFLWHRNGDTWTDAWEDETGTGPIVVSPDWRRIAPFQGHNPLNGPNTIFVLNVATGSPAYHLPAYRRLLHGAFSLDGSEAFLVATAQEDPDETSSLLRVRAESGEVLASTRIPGALRSDLSVRAVVAGDRLVVAYDVEEFDHWHIRVLRADDLSLETDLPLPDPAVTGSWVYTVLVSAPDASAAFLVTTTSSGFWHHRIDLLPE